jgi:hypothetical protein
MKEGFGLGHDVVLELGREFVKEAYHPLQVLNERPTMRHKGAAA